MNRWPRLWQDLLYVRLAASAPQRQSLDKGRLFVTGLELMLQRTVGPAVHPVLLSSCQKQQPSISDDMDAAEQRLLIGSGQHCVRQPCGASSK